MNFRDPAVPTDALENDADKEGTNEEDVTQPSQESTSQGQTLQERTLQEQTSQAPTSHEQMSPERVAIDVPSVLLQLDGGSDSDMSTILYQAHQEAGETIQVMLVSEGKENQASGCTFLYQAHQEAGKAIQVPLLSLETGRKLGETLDETVGKTEESLALLETCECSVDRLNQEEIAKLESISLESIETGKQSANRRKSRNVSEPSAVDYEKILDEFPKGLRDAVRALPKHPVPAVLHQVIVSLCKYQWWTAAELAKLLKYAKAGYLTEKHLGPLVRQGLLVRRFSNHPMHPKQAYHAPDEGESESVDTTCESLLNDPE